MAPCPSRGRRYFQGVQFLLQGYGYLEAYLALCRCPGKIILLASGWRALSLLMRAHIITTSPAPSVPAPRWKSRSILSQPCMLSPQKCIHSKTGVTAFVLWVEDNGWASWWVSG